MLHNSFQTLVVLLRGSKVSVYVVSWICECFNSHYQVLLVWLHSWGMCMSVCLLSLVCLTVLGFLFSCSAALHGKWCMCWCIGSSLLWSAVLLLGWIWMSKVRDAETIERYWAKIATWKTVETLELLSPVTEPSKPKRNYLYYFSYYVY